MELRVCSLGPSRKTPDLRLRSPLDKSALRSLAPSVIYYFSFPHWLTRRTVSNLWFKHNNYICRWPAVSVFLSFFRWPFFSSICNSTLLCLVLQATSNPVWVHMRYKKIFEKKTPKTQALSLFSNSQGFCLAFLCFFQFETHSKSDWPNFSCWLTITWKRTESYTKSNRIN